jgi:ketosteroid isomerase-like protein
LPIKKNWKGENKFMNKYLNLLLAIVFTSTFAACQQAPVDETKNVKVVQAMYDAFAKGDVDAVVAAMTLDIKWNEAENFPYADGNPYVGPQAVVDGVFSRLGADWEYWNLKIDHMVSSGDEVVVFGRYVAKNRSTGKAINAQFVHDWTVHGGKAANFQQYADTAQVLAAMQ